MPPHAEEKKAVAPRTAYPKPSQRRTSISVDRGIGEEFSCQADRAGKPLYAFANDWLATATRISSQGGSANEAEAEWRVCSVFKDVEAIPLPAEFVERIAEDLCEADKEKALKTFRGLGEALTAILRIYAPRIEQLADLAKGFSGIAPLKRLDIERADERKLVVSVVGAGRKHEVTECAFEFLRGLLAGYGYAVAAYELGVGTIRLEAERQPGALRRRAVPLPA
jgi:hypothetical protein